MNSDLTLEDLTKRLNNLSSTEKLQLRSMLGDGWFLTPSDEEIKNIQTLLEKSQEQIKRGEGRSVENILQESRKKYGI